MNNKLLTSLFCITVLACLPACSKQKKAVKHEQEEINTMIELDDSIFETEENLDQKMIKF